MAFARQLQEGYRSMELIPIFQDQHKRLSRSSIDFLLTNFDEHKLRSRPHGATNPTVWILWHMARSEDVGTNCLVTDGNQVFDDQEWGTKLNVSTRLLGTGMTAHEVDTLAADISIPALRDYYDAVRERTATILGVVHAASLADIVPVERLQTVLVSDGAVVAALPAVLKLYANRRKAWFLMHLGLVHNFYHASQIVMARKLWGLPELG